MLNVMLSSIDQYLSVADISEKTAETYGHHLHRLAAWLDQAGLGEGDIDAPTLARWIKSHESWSSSTRYLAACAAKAWLKWKCGACHPALSLRVRREDPGPQRTWSEAQVMQLLSSIDTSRPIGKRNLAMITLFLDTGFRASEMCRLTLDHIDLRDRTATVRIKGKRWGDGVFSEYTAACLVAWLAIRPSIARPEIPNVFVAVHCHVGKPLTAGGLRSIFRALGENAGLGLVSPHDFRRSFATIALRHKASTRLVQLGGRWKRSSEVDRYSQGLDVHDFDPHSPVNHVMGIP